MPAYGKRLENSPCFCGCESTHQVFLEDGMTLGYFCHRHAEEQVEEENSKITLLNIREHLLHQIRILIGEQELAYTSKHIQEQLNKLLDKALKDAYDLGQEKEIE